MVDKRIEPEAHLNFAPRFPKHRHWQPIGSAPKDGTHIDIWFVRRSDTDNGYRETDCYWGRFKDTFQGPYRECWMGDHYNGNSFPAGSYTDSIATHWMRTPEAPKKPTQYTLSEAAEMMESIARPFRKKL